MPGKVVEVDGTIATVDFWGIRRQIRLDIVDEPVAPGDYVLNHVGYAIRRIPPGEVVETLALFEQLLAAPHQDLMAQDVQFELAATEVAATEVAATEVAATEVAATEVPATEVATTEMAATEMAATEIAAAVAATEMAATEMAVGEPETR